MSDLFSLFESDGPAEPARPKPLNDKQRQTLRELFATLGVATAAAQFDVVHEVTGQRITKVMDLTEDDARLLIIQLRHRATNVGRSTGGDLWAEREGDTWIDKI